MQGRHLQISTLRFLIFALKPWKEVPDLKSWDEFVNKKVDLHDRVSRSYHTVFFVLFHRIWKLRILCTFTRKIKRKVIIGGAILSIYFYQKGLQVSLMFWWMSYSLHLEIKSWKNFFWPLFIIHRALSCNLFELLGYLEQNIQTKGH